MLWFGHYPQQKSGFVGYKKPFLSLNPSYFFFFKDIFDLTNIFMPK